MIHRVGRTAAPAAATLAASLATLAASGCAPEAGFRDAPAPVVAGQPAVSAQQKADAEKVAEAFVAALKAKNADAARATLATPPPAGQSLDAWIKAERLEPLAEAGEWKAEEVRAFGKSGDKLLLRASFRAGDAAYRTNVTLSRTGGDGAPWRVADVLPPVRPTAPVGSEPAGSAAAPKVGG